MESFRKQNYRQYSCTKKEKLEIFSKIFFITLSLILAYYIITSLIYFQNTTEQMQKLLETIDRDLDEISPSLLGAIDQMKTTLENFWFSKPNNKTRNSNTTNSEKDTNTNVSWWSSMFWS